jgi:hypothetical protein
MTEIICKVEVECLWDHFVFIPLHGLLAGDNEIDEMYYDWEDEGVLPFREDSPLNNFILSMDLPKFLGIEDSLVWSDWKEWSL